MLLKLLVKGLICYQSQEYIGFSCEKFFKFVSPLNKLEVSIVSLEDTIITTLQYLLYCTINHNYVYRSVCLGTVWLYRWIKLNVNWHKILRQYFFTRLTKLKWHSDLSTRYTLDKKRWIVVKPLVLSTTTEQKKELFFINAK